MRHLEDSASAGMTLCGECVAGLDGSHTIVAFGQMFSCKDCLSVAQQMLDKFTTYEWEVFITLGQGRGFRVEFEQLTRGPFPVACCVYDIEMRVPVERHHHTALQAAIDAVSLLVTMSRDSLRLVAIDANGVDIGGTRRALERVDANLDQLKRSVLLLEDLRALEASFPKAMIEKEDKS